MRKIRKDSKVKKAGEVKVAKDGSITTRGGAYIEMRGGKLVGYSLRERPDGFFFIRDDGSKEWKISSSTRNWMQAEQKARKIFDEEVKRFQDKGQFRDAGSTMWFSHYDTSTSTFAPVVKEVTRLKRYGMNPYNLGFEKRENIERSKGKTKYDQTYYSIDWRPVKLEDGSYGPDEIFISKSFYPKDASASSSEARREILSDVVQVTDKEGVKRITDQFKKLYAEVK